ncbi:MAG: hypothetical protein LBD37_05820 [Treponema sp.]|jgi:hypothetical protein|nr:hypothetical protein [Treponema sp.]
MYTKTCSLLVFFLCSLSPGGTLCAEAPAGRPFICPLLDMYETALSGVLRWRPDWPADLPPDAFQLPETTVSAIALRFPPGGELILRRNSQGILTEFPLLLGDSFYGVAIRLSPGGAVQGFRVAAEEPWHITLFSPAAAPGLPQSAWVSDGAAVHVARFFYASSQAWEVWHDERGAVLGTYTYCRSGSDGKARLAALQDGDGTPREAYYYDAWGNVSAVSSSRGEFSALYVQQGRPRYWTRQLPAPLAGAGEQPEVLETAPRLERYALQWDEGAFLRRMTGPGGAEGGEGRDYTYRLDMRENWMERRERSGKGSAPSGGRITRLIGYQDETRDAMALGGGR